MKLFPSLLILFAVLFFSCDQTKDKKPEQPKPSGNCLYSRDEKDPLGKRIRVVQEEKFISLSYTDSAAKELFNGQDFLKGYLSCVSVDSVFGIYFDFIINSEDAFQYYGLIKKNNKIIFILKSGKSVELHFGNTFSGNTNLSGEFTEYSSYAPLAKSEAQMLVSEELKRVRISWSKKDEDYEAVNPKIFINQIPCVE